MSTHTILVSEVNARRFLRAFCHHFRKDVEQVITIRNFRDARKLERTPSLQLNTHTQRTYNKRACQEFKSKTTSPLSFVIKI
jgi:hypothetical protein